MGRSIDKILSRQNVREFWVTEHWLLGSPEMKNYFLSKRDPAAEFHNGSCQNYFKVIEASHVERLEKMLRVAVEAMSKMHESMQNRNFESHVSLASNPMQNGCIVYSEWKIKDIKEKALAEIEQIAGEK